MVIRAFEDEAKARLGVVECAKHELLQPFSVLHEKEGECFTSLLIMFHIPYAFWYWTSFILWLLSISFILNFLGEFVAQFKFTVLLMANGPHRITNGPLDPELYKSEHEVQDPELKVSVDLHFCDEASITKWVFGR